MGGSGESKLNTRVNLLCFLFSCAGGSSPKVLCTKGTYSAATGQSSSSTCVVSFCAFKFTDLRLYLYSVSEMIDLLHVSCG